MNRGMTHEEALRLLKTQRIDGDDLHEAFDMAIKALEDSRWIPLTERLPEALVDVIVTDGEKVFVAWIGYDGVWFGGGASHIKLTAWMPLPKPYEVATLFQDGCKEGAENDKT